MPQTALDFAFLRAEGVRQLERLAGGVWTDHNTHDPGITILEQVCYALTDLVYRAGYELPDLLASAGGDPYASLFTPAQILPTNPVTLDDLRRLVLDVPGVKNAWIDVIDEPVAKFDEESNKEVSYLAPQSDSSDARKPGLNTTEVRVKGLYRVSIEAELALDIEGGKLLRRDVAQRLHGCRALGEDFHEIRILKQQLVPLKAVLETDGSRHAPTLLAEVYKRIVDYMSPQVLFCKSVEKMLARGRRVDEVFEGPLLEQGFLDAQDLARIERRCVLRLSDLIHELMLVPGVIAVKNLQFLGAGRDWVLTIHPDFTPQFDLKESDIRVHRKGSEVDHDGLKEALDRLLSECVLNTAAPVPAVPPPQRDLRPPQGRDRQVGAYHSVLHDFPAVYGIGPGGLPESASPERKAQAKQLKAYLMFFDQLLANQFAQLASAPQLLSFQDTAPASYDSYFCQLARDDAELGLDGLRVSSHDAHLKKLQLMMEGVQAGVQRRNRFLGHLLARFGERVRDHALLRPPESKDGKPFEEEAQLARYKEEAQLARYKQALLRDYPRLSRDRGRGFNYLKPVDTSSPDGNISGLELVLRRKLDVTDHEEQFYLVEHVLLRPMPGDEYQQGPLLRYALGADPYSLCVTLVFPDWPARFHKDKDKESSFRAFVERTVREETPVHLAVRVLWKSRDEMKTFQSAHAIWLARWRAARRAELGL